MQLSYFPNTATWDKAHVCTNTNILVGSKTRVHVLGNGIEIIYDLVFSILDALPPGILHTGGPSLWGYPQKLSALLKLIFIGVQLLYNVMLVSARMHACSVPELCPTLCDSLDCSPLGSSVLGISQARVMEWVAISSSRGSSQARDWTCISCISCIGRQILYHWATWKALCGMIHLNYCN